MTPIEKRKAGLREYIEAYKFALNGVYEDDNGNGVSENIDRWLTWEIKAANESARIAEQLLECIEALEKVKQEYWNRCYAGSGTIKALSINDFDNMIDKTLNKIAGAEGDTTNGRIEK